MNKLSPPLSLSIQIVAYSIRLVVNEAIREKIRRLIRRLPFV